MLDDDTAFSIAAKVAMESDLGNWDPYQSTEQLRIRCPTDGVICSNADQGWSAGYGPENQHQPRPWAEIKKGYTDFAEGDVGLAKITPCFENGKSTVFRELTERVGQWHNRVAPLFDRSSSIRITFIVFLKCPHFIETVIPRMTGTAGQKRVLIFHRIFCELAIPSPTPRRAAPYRRQGR